MLLQEPLSPRWSLPTFVRRPGSQERSSCSEVLWSDSSVVALILRWHLHQSFPHSWILQSAKIWKPWDPVDISSREWPCHLINVAIERRGREEDMVSIEGLYGARSCLCSYWTLSVILWFPLHQNQISDGLTIYSTRHCRFGVRIQTQVYFIHSTGFQTLVIYRPWAIGAVSLAIGSYCVSLVSSVMWKNRSEKIMEAPSRSPLIDVFPLPHHPGALKTTQEGPILLLSLYHYCQ